MRQSAAAEALSGSGSARARRVRKRFSSEARKTAALARKKSERGIPDLSAEVVAATVLLEAASGGVSTGVARLRLTPLRLVKQLIHTWRLAGTLVVRLASYANLLDL